MYLLYKEKRMKEIKMEKSEMCSLQNSIGMLMLFIQKNKKKKQYKTLRVEE